MFLHIIALFKSMFLFTGSYSNTVFPEPLSKEEELKCIEEMKVGNTEARNKLIEHNLRLVAHIVKKFELKTKDTDDLISIGTIGLIKGIDSFNQSKDTRITTYAARCIENEILMYFRGNKKRTNTVSLNDSIGFDKEGNEINLMDILKDEQPDIGDFLHTKNNIALLKRYLVLLTPREKDIIERRYGLLNKKEQTQKEIAKDMHISRSYVSRIEKRALTKILKEFIKSQNCI